MNTPAGLKSASCNLRMFSITEHTRHIDLKHHVRICLCVLQGRRLLLDARCSDQTVQLALGVANALHRLVESLDISYVDLSVV